MRKGETSNCLVFLLEKSLDFVLSQTLSTHCLSTKYVHLQVLPLILSLRQGFVCGSHSLALKLNDVSGYLISN